MNIYNPISRAITTRNLIVKMAICCFLSVSNPHRALADLDPSYLEEVNTYLEQKESRAAIIILKNALQKNPNDAIARHTLGNIYLDSGDIASAEKELRRAHELDPNNAEVRVNLAKAYFQNVKFKKLDPLISDTDGWPPELITEAYTIQAQVKIYQGEFEQAEMLLFKARQINENQKDVLYTLAFLKKQQRQLNEAEKYLTKLFNQHPDHTQGLLLNGDIALARKDYQSAIQLFNRLINLQKDNGLVRVKLAQALAEDNQLDAASKHLEEILAIMPRNPAANYLQAVIDLQNKDYDKASRHAETTLLQVENHLESLYIAAVANYHQNRLETAYQQIDTLLKRAPQHAESLKLKATLELKMGLNDQATTTFSQIENEDFQQNDIELLIAAGFTSLRSGDYDLGKRLLQQATALKSDDVRIHLGQASVALKQGDTESAIAELLQATAKEPDSETNKIALIISYLNNQQFDQAIEVAQQFSLAHPQSPHGATLEGLAYGMKNDLKNAENAFRRALSIKPGDPNASHNLAELVMRQNNDVAEARRLHEDVIKYHPNDLRSLLQLFFIDQQAGEHQQAANWLEDAVEANPDALRPRLLLSQLYLRQNKPTQALAVVEQALPSHPDNLDLLALIGDAQRLSGQQVQAIDSFQRLSELAPESLLPQYRLATIYETTGQLTLAYDAVNRALAISPDHQGALYLKGRIALKSGYTEEANIIVDRLRKAIPNNPLVTELQAQIALASNQPAEAVTLYRKILTDRENNFINIQLASALWQQAKRQEAIDTLKQWQNRYPDDPLTISVLANFYMLDNQFDKARNQFENIVKLTPDNAWAHNNLAWLLLQVDNVETALNHAQQALKLDPDNPNIKDTLGTILLEIGNYHAAKTLLTDAATLLTQDFNIQFRLALANERVGKTDSAEEILTQILSPENSEISFSSREKAEQLLRELKLTKNTKKSD